MKATLIDSNKNLVWSDVDDPTMKDDEALVEIHAAALNRADLLQRQGKYPPPPGCPEWMGLEIAGVVKQVGGAAAQKSNWRVGDRVCALLGGGGYAEMVSVRHDMLMPVPAVLSMNEAAALPEAFATSYLNLCVEGGLKAGDTVLIHAGASGLGIAAIQLSKTFGARVVTTVSSPAKAAAVASIGADVIVNRKTDDLGKVLDENPVDIVLDCVGGTNLGKHLEKLAVGGRWILIATLGGEFAEISLRPILRRGLKLIGSTLRSRSPDMKARILADLVEKTWPAIESGAIRPVIHSVLPVERAEEAHAILERNENTGKVVLAVKS